MKAGWKEVEFPEFGLILGLIGSLSFDHPVIIMIRLGFLQCMKGKTKNFQNEEKKTRVRKEKFVTIKMNLVRERGKNK